MPLDLQELDRQLADISSNTDFLYNRSSTDSTHTITAVGKGFVITFTLDYERQTVQVTNYTDSFATSDGSHTDVAPRPLDTDRHIETAKSAIQQAIKETVDPTLIE